MSKGDEVLRAYLRAGDEDSEEALTQLCQQILMPVCLKVVRSKLWRHNEDAQDVAQDVAMRLIRRLREIRRSGGSSNIRDVTCWAMGAATKACSDFLRKEHPIRSHLAIALRYRLQKSVAFSLWKASNGRMVCGWHRCRAVPPLSELEFQQALDLPRVAVCLVGIEPEYSVKLWRALARLFACANGPVYFQWLISELLNRSGTGDGWRCGLEGIAEPASDDQADGVTIQRALLERLWQAIMTLSFEERCVLLLNLRGTEGLAVWWQHDIVSQAKIAEAVGLLPEELERLPLADLEIADTLGIREPNEAKRRQRVINLRRTAKRRVSEHLTAD